MCDFLLINFERNYDILKSNSSYFLLNKNITRSNQKWKIPHTTLERWNLRFSFYKNCKLKVKLWLVGACEGKKRAAFVPVILSEGTFLTSVFYLNVQCIECNFRIYSKIIISYSFLLVSKIIESLQCNNFSYAIAINLGIHHTTLYELYE